MRTRQKEDKRERIRQRKKGLCCLSCLLLSALLIFPQRVQAEETCSEEDPVCLCDDYELIIIEDRRKHRRGPDKKKNFSSGQEMGRPGQSFAPVKDPVHPKKNQNYSEQTGGSSKSSVQHSKKSGAQKVSATKPQKSQKNKGNKSNKGGTAEGQLKDGLKNQTAEKKDRYDDPGKEKEEKQTEEQEDLKGKETEEKQVEDKEEKKDQKEEDHWIFGEYAKSIDQMHISAKDRKGKITIHSDNPEALIQNQLILTRDGQLIKEINLILDSTEGREDKTEEEEKKDQEEGAEEEKIKGQEEGTEEGKRDREGKKDEEEKGEKESDRGVSYTIDPSHFEKSGRYMIRLRTGDQEQTISFSLDREGPDIEEGKIKQEEGKRWLYIFLYDRSGLAEIKASQGEKVLDVKERQVGEGENWKEIKVEAVKGTRLQMKDQLGNSSAFVYDGEKLIEEEIIEEREKDKPSAEKERLQA